MSGKIEIFPDKLKEASKNLKRKVSESNEIKQHLLNYRCQSVFEVSKVEENLASMKSIIDVTLTLFGGADKAESGFQIKDLYDKLTLTGQSTLALSMLNSKGYQVRTLGRKKTPKGLLSKAKYYRNRKVTVSTADWIKGDGPNTLGRKFARFMDDVAKNPNKNFTSKALSKVTQISKFKTFNHYAKYHLLGLSDETQIVAKNLAKPVVKKLFHEDFAININLLLMDIYV